MQELSEIRHQQALVSAPLPLSGMEIKCSAYRLLRKPTKGGTLKRDPKSLFLNRNHLELANKKRYILQDQRDEALASAPTWAQQFKSTSHIPGRAASSAYGLSCPSLMMLQC